MMAVGDRRLGRKRQRPESSMATKVVDGKTVRTRPLCPYPAQVCKGTGSADEATNFSCRMP